jgi:hypothetical protein
MTGLVFAFILPTSFPKQKHAPFFVAVPANNAIPGDTRKASRKDEGKDKTDTSAEIVFANKSNDPRMPGGLTWQQVCQEKLSL